MSMSRRMVSWTVAGALVLGGTVLATAQERPRREGRPDRAAIQAELGLSADQAAQIEKLRVEGRKQAIRQRADLAIARLELQELMNAPTVDEKAVAAKVKAVSDLQAAGLKARVDERLAMRRVLTPEQQEKMKQLMRQHRQDRGARPGRAWRGGRPGAGTPPPAPGPGGPWSDEGDAPPVPEPGR
jgi:Spy/CpxP family protein refolding chaperone